MHACAPCQDLMQSGQALQLRVECYLVMPAGSCLQVLLSTAQVPCLEYSHIYILTITSLVRSV